MSRTPNARSTPAHPLPAVDPRGPANRPAPAPPIIGWRSENHWPAPRTVVYADDRMTASDAYRLANAGTALLWTGDFHNARQLLGALARRIDGAAHRARRPTADPEPATVFARYRADAHRSARLLGLVLVPLGADYTIPLRRAPDARAACAEAYGPAGSGASATGSVVSLRELLGVIGAHEWRTKGVQIPALGARIHPHYGVFSPVRGEYLDLVDSAPLPVEDWTARDGGGPGAGSLTAFDIGTGTGVIAAILARRGVGRVIGTDQAPRALVCARENISRLGLAETVDIVEADLFPAGRANLVVCNPPWIPAEAVTATDTAVYDPGSRMLRGFLSGLAARLEPSGEGWLVLSDIAEHLGLRSRGELLDLIEDSGLEVVARLDTRPVHRKATEATDPLHAARAAEVTSLWRVRPASALEPS